MPQLQLDSLRQSVDYQVTNSGTFKKGQFCIGKKWRELKFEDLVMDVKLGSGSSGVVYLAHYAKDPNQVLAVKVISMFDQSRRMEIMKELKALDNANCPYLVGFYGAFYDEGSISLALEYMNGGSLLDLYQFTPIPEAVLSRIVDQVLLGLKYLQQERHVVHRDVKPSNVLLNDMGLCKLADFGVSSQLENTAQNCETFVGTVTYMSPERLSGNSYAYSCDIWSLGILVVECITQSYPYPSKDGLPPTNGFWDLLDHLDKYGPPLLNEKFSPEIRSFVQACLKRNPNERAKVNDLLVHPFIQKYKNIETVNNYGIWIKQAIKGLQAKQKTKLISKKQDDEIIGSKLDRMMDELEF